MNIQWMIQFNLLKLSLVSNFHNKKYVQFSLTTSWFWEIRFCDKSSISYCLTKFFVISYIINYMIKTKIILCFLSGLHPSIFLWISCVLFYYSIKSKTSFFIFSNKIAIFFFIFIFNIHISLTIVLQSWSFYCFTRLSNVLGLTNPEPRIIIIIYGGSRARGTFGPCSSLFSLLITIFVLFYYIATFNFSYVSFESFGFYWIFSTQCNLVNFFSKCIRVFTSKSYLWF